LNILRILADGLILTGLTIGASYFGSPFVHGTDGENIKPVSKRRIQYLIYLAGLIFTVLEVYFIYRGQENSDLFFWHPYLAWTIANVCFMLWSLCRREQTGVDVRKLLVERILLWQVVVNTIFAGFALSVGWIMKLYIR